MVEFVSGSNLVKDTVMTQFSTVVKLEVDRSISGVPSGMMAGLLFKLFSRMSTAKMYCRVLNNFLGGGRVPVTYIVELIFGNENGL